MITETEIDFERNPEYQPTEMEESVMKMVRLFVETLQKVNVSDMTAVIATSRGEVELTIKMKKGDQ